MLFECMDTCVLSPAHKCETRGSLVYLLIVRYLAIWFKFRHGILDWAALSCHFGRAGGGGLKTYLEESVDYIIYRDYTVNRSSLIHCSLVCRLRRWPENGRDGRWLTAVVFLRGLNNATSCQRALCLGASTSQSETNAYYVLVSCSPRPSSISRLLKRRQPFLTTGGRCPEPYARSMVLSEG